MHQIVRDCQTTTQFLLMVSHPGMPECIPTTRSSPCQGQAHDLSKNRTRSVRQNMMERQLSSDSQASLLITLCPEHGLKRPNTTKHNGLVVKDRHKACQTMRQSNAVLDSHARCVRHSPSQMRPRDVRVIKGSHRTSSDSQNSSDSQKCLYKQ